MVSSKTLTHVSLADERLNATSTTPILIFHFFQLSPYVVNSSVEMGAVGNRPTNTKRNLKGINR